MFTTSSMRVTALLAAAFTLAACGSDKAAGPSTANNEQIISEMTAALQTAGDSESFEHFITLQAAIMGLSAGAPVNAGNVTIDGHSHSFNTTSMTIEEHDSTSGEVLDRLTLVVGWRHTDGDSLFFAMYAPSVEEVPMDRRTAATFMQRPRAGTPSLADVAAMLRSGRYTISRSVAAGPDEPAIFAIKLGDEIWSAYSDEGIVSGSISFSSSSGDCNVGGTDGSAFDVDLVSCEMLRSNVALQANTFDDYSEADPPPAGPSVAITSQPVIGVKLIAQGSSTGT
ncbi:MAG TPA: hypothetical protein VFK04_13815 [Gemmatimonadaceae bacterium]|nr:hypothetical protein [Gemmatimonadaceae bacterium]